ncbi:2-aminobenzoate-CoA ligase [Rhodoferax sp. TH121]|uniref:AMP-binding protein n=1 Tax=Rhodoferax sp. TH121 TaxID=2022803 RepID=UPI000B978C9A|nr:AMP-binding protein [Rhodoferax sp. TH121]OYQ38963.1 2-aminobenzoate-CoA ligase [Rhodoferax sp. TH121]
MPTAHIDTFARDHLPPVEQQPDFLFTLPELQFPEQLNCATELLDRHVREGHGDRACVRGPREQWTYRDLWERANRIAHVLVQDMGLVPGNRVLLHAPNTPMMVACWFGIVKAGGIVVATMPLLRAKELKPILEIGQISHALCDASLVEEVQGAAQAVPGLREIRCFNAAGSETLEAAMQAYAPLFDNVDTAADDTCLIGFTSGTTGIPKATMHFHRDVMAICACWPRSVLRATADDVFIGSPPLGFTFGLGGLVLFPMSIGASTVLLEKAGPPQLLDGIRDFGATVVFTAPTSYRTLAARGEELRATRLRKCVSAGEALPASTRTLWREATGIELIDGIGATEMLHIFISADEQSARAGATGKVVPGYEACVVDDDGRPLPPGTVGKLAVRGPTGCRYLNDARQQAYVKNGWNLTGDAYLMDEDGYFIYQSRTDDMIISAGYNIAAPEVEEGLMLHPAVLECAVIGVPDAERGQIVKAFVVLRPGHTEDAAMVKTLQDFVKKTIAPYKYPRAIEFFEKLPRTQSGKLQRFRLRES